jgi:Sulfotransferase family
MEKRGKPAHIFTLILLILTTLLQISNYQAKLNHLNVLPSLLSQNTTEDIHRQDNLTAITIPPILQRNRYTEDSTQLVQYGDFIYLKNDWDGAPVVLEEFKLIFFAAAKVACTTWKQLFRRMMGQPDWKLEEYKKLLPWNPELNGLKYLYDYNPEKASEMMTSSNWTRAIFIRDPKERFLSAYLDKVVKNEYYLNQKCCPYTYSCFSQAKSSLHGFLQVMYTCDDAHWRPQHKRMEEKYWSYVNFVGRMESLEEDSERLLKKVGAWEEYGRTGWGKTKKEHMFQAKAGGSGRRHATSASQKLKSYLTPELEKAIDQYYAKDYDNVIMNLTKVNLFD